ncbi:nucleotide-binding universal stress UspA family protein [Mumia flava]|uniref:Nucleotide-binding universal stress UspA family protein n=1 Tax=Mumia flava TaxID=1348852 RepID=A0A0B2BPI5_9ACTN|nr:universal stress protein [Mumia flava]PJJ56618.1 nucleotide-binding universal stress UspA family protein [Mumia flava]
MDTIVTGVDGSETATAAARTAARLAVALGARLHVISAYGKFEAERVDTAGEEILLTTEAAADGLAHDTIRALRQEFPGLDATAAPADGQAADALVRAADELSASLIVVGNKRVQGLARVLGSIATDVAHKAPCDVYIAHTHQR